MLDFFDEDFPLTKKQEEIKKAMEAAEKSALSDAPKPAENDSTSVNTPPVADEPVAVEQTALMGADRRDCYTSRPRGCCRSHR